MIEKKKKTVAFFIPNLFRFSDHCTKVNCLTFMGQFDWKGLEWNEFDSDLDELNFASIIQF